MIWNFIQEQILGMKWLNELIGNALNRLGLDMSGNEQGVFSFFIYDVIKITILLGTFIAICAIGITIVGYLFKFFSKFYYLGGL